MTNKSLSQHLYECFWERNGGADKAPPFNEQSPAIVKMWINIALDAEMYLYGAAEDPATY